MELGRRNGLQYAQQVEHVRTDSLRLSELPDDDEVVGDELLVTHNPQDIDNFTGLT